MNYAVLEKKGMENVKKYSYIKLVKTAAERNYLVSKPNCHTKTFFLETLLAIQVRKKIRLFMNKQVYLGI